MPGPLTTDGQFEIEAAMPVRGIATSGWRGRSFSLGIADSVTVLAATAAQADAAATVIANAVDVEDAGIHRLPASACKDDSDLGDLLVTTGVDTLAPEQVRRALDAGAARALDLQARRPRLVGRTRLPGAVARGPALKLAGIARSQACGRRAGRCSWFSICLTKAGLHFMIDIRRVFTQVEHIHHEFGPRAATPLVRGAIAAVLTNPFAGRYEPDILPMMKLLDPVGVDMAHRLRAAMDVPVEQIATYGKGAIVGAAGELEHGALWHVPGGYAMRELLGWKGDRDAYRQGKAEEKSGQPGNALSIVPSTKKVGPPGAALDVPLTNINASYVRGQFDAIEVRVPGAPAADEIVYILAMSTGYRVHDRVGGLRAEDISKWDGLR